MVKCLVICQVSCYMSSVMYLVICHVSELFTMTRVFMFGGDMSAVCGLVLEGNSF